MSCTVSFKVKLAGTGRVPVCAEPPCVQSPIAGALKGLREGGECGLSLQEHCYTSKLAPSPFGRVLCGHLSPRLGSDPPSGTGASTPGLFCLSVYFSWLLTPIHLGWRLVGRT